MNIALYARVSTHNGQQDPELQLRELREYCANRGWDVFGEYVDRASGAKDKRKELDRLMADALRHRFAVVVVWRFDRFARSVSHLLRALETFRALGIEFVSLSEQVDTSTPMGKMVFTVLGAVAELERSLIVERVRAGLRNARAKGKRLGRPRASVSATKIRELRSEGLHEATALVTISEGPDRQHAAEHLAIQIADYFDANTWADAPEVDVMLDEAIIRDPTAYSDFLKRSNRPLLQRLTFRSVQSQDSGLVQLADILAGFNRLTTDIALGRSNKQIQVFDNGLDDNVDIDLLNYICLSLRWNTWGEVPPPPNPDDPQFDGTWPFKHVGGYGLRLHSSVVSDDVRDAIYSARVVYMGCLH